MSTYDDRAAWAAEDRAEWGEWDLYRDARTCRRACCVQIEAASRRERRVA